MSPHLKPVLASTLPARHGEHGGRGRRLRHHRRRGLRGTGGAGGMGFHRRARASPTSTTPTARAEVEPSEEAGPRPPKPQASPAPVRYAEGEGRPVPDPARRSSTPSTSQQYRTPPLLEALGNPFGRHRREPAVRHPASSSCCSARHGRGHAEPPPPSDHAACGAGAARRPSSSGFAYIGMVIQAVASLFNPCDSAPRPCPNSAPASSASPPCRRTPWTRALRAALQFVAMISVSLGVMNLLPIPPLDGGRLVVEAFQKVHAQGRCRRKALNYMSAAGMAAVPQDSSWSWPTRTSSASCSGTGANGRPPCGGLHHVTAAHTCVGRPAPARPRWAGREWPAATHVCASLPVRSHFHPVGRACGFPMVMTPRGPATG